MEPMTLGSPVNSPNTSQGQYLPPFLMGDSQAMTPHKNTLSPKPGRYNVSFATSPPGSASHDFNRSGINTFFGPGGSGSHGSGGHGINSSNASLSAVSSLNHQTGPPTMGLFESMREQAPYAPRNHLSVLNHSQNLSYNQSHNQNQSYHHNDSYAQNTPNVSNASMRPFYSPLGARMSPMTCGGTPAGGGGAGVNVTSPNRGDLWVTIFGYVPGSSSMVQQHFTICGTILEVSHAPKNGNWMHVRFSSRVESEKALNFNQKVIGGNVMVGVTRCTDQDILDKENCNAPPDAEEQIFSAKRPTIRPTVQQSYKLAQNDATVVPATGMPTRSTGLVSKAMELLGW